ncbi:MAG TPA: delta-aminolevulinic acid dehydratase, partial [Halieaceae bacterium]|nr:delta-aminolevulinic acid dehydratase [Halieaceae bacterium]
AYIRGEVSRDALQEASREDPALRELMLDTSEFLRDVR